jgi:hypothetical protein
VRGLCSRGEIRRVRGAGLLPIERRVNVAHDESTELVGVGEVKKRSKKGLASGLGNSRRK